MKLIHSRKPLPVLNTHRPLPGLSTPEGALLSSEHNPSRVVLDTSGAFQSGENAAAELQGHAQLSDHAAEIRELMEVNGLGTDTEAEAIPDIAGILFSHHVTAFVELAVNFRFEPVKLDVVGQSHERDVDPGSWHQKMKRAMRTSRMIPRLLANDIELTRGWVELNNPCILSGVRALAIQDQNPEERTGKGLTSELETTDSYRDIELENMINCGACPTRVSVRFSASTSSREPHPWALNLINIVIQEQDKRPTEEFKNQLESTKKEVVLGRGQRQSVEEGRRNSVHEPGLDSLAVSVSVRRSCSHWGRFVKGNLSPVVQFRNWALPESNIAADRSATRIKPWTTIRQGCGVIRGYTSNVKSRRTGHRMGSV
ncbi:hypothetical protein C8R46DRAFT_1044795 [Mycena filopes]|nr:hypothetical protein C8R46DRAFT_1044795 [Mycena filopes]